MATKKTAPKKAAKEKTMIIKIAEKVGELAGKIVNEKEHLVEMAAGAIKTVKSNFNKNPAIKKAAPKKTAKAAVKKVEKKVIKKASPAVKKITKSASLPKPASVKKAVKKVAKKGATKK